ncbi:MAG: diguanylate cyclase [Caloramator sp.]|nr:diguanylate cyclase [Caloramator sp.]
MRIINNRYRLIKKVYQNDGLASYQAIDIKKSQGVCDLKIINFDYLDWEFYDFLVSNFIMLTSIVHNNLKRLYSFDIIESKNGRLDRNYQYFYTTEFLEDVQSLNILEELSIDERLNLFIEVARTINFLHLKGYTYNSINLSNINFIKDDNKIKVKLNDVVTARISEYLKAKRSQIIFKAPEIIEGEGHTVKSDIYSLGVLFLIMLLGGVKFNKVEEGLLKLNDLLPKEYLGIIDIIKKMIKEDPEERYCSITKVIKVLNELLNKDFSPFEVEELEKINYNIKLSGRDKEIKKIFDSFRKEKGCILISGETGIGKTRFLKELEFLFRLNNINCFSYYNEVESNSKRIFLDIARKIFAEGDDNLNDEFRDELLNTFEEFKNSIISEEIYNEKNRIRMINTIYRYMKNKYKDERIVIIIDDFNSLDKFTYLIAKDILNSKIADQAMFILSFRSDALINNDIRALINDIRKEQDTVEIKLKGLSLEHTSEMIKNLLTMAYTPKLFSSKIYEITYGNPLFIVEIIKDLYLKGDLFINSSTGIWSSKFDDNYDRMILPNSVEQAIFNQINELDENNIIVLEVISIFQNGVTVEVLSDFLNREKNKLINILKNLETKGIVISKISDEGIVYDLQNQMLKRLIYNRIDENVRVDLHQKAGRFLEKTMRSYLNPFSLKEEILYHYEKANDADKIIEYCIYNAALMKKLNNKNDAISYYEKALKYFKEKGTDCRKIDILMVLGDIYLELGNVKKALELFKQVKVLSLNLKDYNSAIDSMNKLVEIYINKNDNNKIAKSLEEIKDLLQIHDYKRGYLEYQFNMAVYHRNNDKLEDVANICKQALEICDDNCPEIKGKFIKLLGDCCYLKAEPEKAIEYYEKAISYFEFNESKKDMISLLNNLSIIYSDFYQDYDSALEYLEKMKNLAEKEGIVFLKALALINIGEINYIKFNTMEALECFKSALDIIDELGYKTYTFYIYCFLIGIYLRIGNYSKAYFSYLKATDELKNSPNQNIYEGLYYYFSAQLFYKLGDHDKVYQYLKEVLKIHKSNEIRIKWDAEAFLKILTISEEVENLDDEVESLLDLAKKYKNDVEKIYIFYHLALKFLKINKINYAKKMFGLIQNFKLDELPSALKLRINVLEILIYKNKINRLEEILPKLKENKLIELSMMTTRILGDYYKNNIYKAVNYYFNSLNLMLSLIKDLPEEYKIKYLSISNFYRTINKISEILDLDLNEKDGQETNNLLQIAYRFINMQFNKLNIKECIIEKIKSDFKYELNININSINDLLNKITLDPDSDTLLIMELMSYITLATNYLLITDSKNPEIILSKEKVNIDKYSLIIEKAKRLEKTIIVKKSDECGDVTNVICIPLIKNKRKDKFRISTYDIKRNYGYVILETDKFINNFTEEAIEDCKPLVNLLMGYIENINIVNTAIIDKLTSAYTRKILDDVLDENIENAEVNGGVFSIVMVDIDNFKKLNDKYGHLLGDKILRKLGEVVKSNIRKNDLFFRYGGEEFLILLPYTNKYDALNLAERIRKKIETNLFIDGKSVTASFGIASFPEDAEWKEELLEKADKALYVAKEKGKNRCEVWDEAFDQKERVTDKLSGFLTGNDLRDTAKILTMIELTELIKENLSREEIFYKFLGRLLDSSEGKYAGIVFIENGEINNQFWRQANDDNWIKFININKRLLDKVIKEQKGFYGIDWDGIFEYDVVKNVPVLYSIMLVPVVKEEMLKGIVYILAPSNDKEYKFEDYNYMSVLANILAMLI